MDIIASSSISFKKITIYNISQITNDVMYYELTRYDGTKIKISKDEYQELIIKN